MESEYELASFEEAKLPDPISADWVVVVDLDRQSPNIFLSHSGAQKNFVEQLCEDLERAEQSPFFDKRHHCLPKGVEFAPVIFTAAQECELEVVVVSDDYFTRTTWTMLELAAIVQASGSTILPLFFGLSCKDFKNKKRRERWFQVWDGWSKSDNRISVDVWKDALRKLDRLNGMEYVEANGEVAFRKEIVNTVRKMMQQRSQDEIIVVETRATSDAFEFDLHQSSTGATRFNSSMFDCLRKTLFVVFQQVVAFLTILLLFVGYRNYLHDFKASPSNEVKLSAGGFLDNNTITETVQELSLRGSGFRHNTITGQFLSGWDLSYGDVYWTHPIKYMRWTPDHRSGKYTTTALTDVDPAEIEYIQHWTEPVSSLDELFRLYMGTDTRFLYLEESTNEQFVYTAVAFRPLQPQSFNDLSSVLLQLYSHGRSRPHFDKFFWLERPAQRTL